MFLIRNIKNNLLKIINFLLFIFLVNYIELYLLKHVIKHHKKQGLNTADTIIKEFEEITQIVTEIDNDSGKMDERSQTINNDIIDKISQSVEEIEEKEEQEKEEIHTKKEEEDYQYQPTNELSEKLKIIKRLLKESDSILIGAGAGLSVAAGLSDSDLKFEEKFKDFIDVYGFTSIYSGGFYSFSTPEEKWGYLSRNCVIYIDTQSTELYENIFKLVKDKEYFVLTTNVDGHFEKSGFDTNKLFATQGDFVNLQCSVPCHNKLYESVDLLKEMVRKTKDRKIPTELIPKCPMCGQPMTTHLRVDGAFVMDDYWYQQNEAYTNFIKANKDKKVLLLEFGVGFNTPTIIRFPFERETMNNEKWFLVRFNKDYSGLILQGNWDYDTINDWETIKSYHLKNNFQDRFIPISEDINKVIKALLE